MVLTIHSRPVPFVRRMGKPAPKRIGRSGEIRTPDPLLPKQVRYQAALRSARPYVRRDSAAMPPKGLASGEGAL
jgi:hypothetical protein